MHLTFSRVIIALTVGVTLSATTARAQDAVAPPAAPAPAMVEITSVEALFEEVREDLRVAAEAGDSAASLAMARSLFSDPDPAKQAEGVDYLVRAAEAGARDAIEQLGELYANGGYGLAPDPAKARETYERAVKAGSLEALASLGQLLLNTDFSPEGQ